MLLPLVLALSAHADDRKSTWIPCVNCQNAQRFDPDDAMAAVQDGQRLTERMLKRADDRDVATCLSNKATLLGSIETLTDGAVDRILAAVDADRPYLLKVAEDDVAVYVSRARTITADARACAVRSEP
jgi:hypothetical protein